jgi:uncharacterized protein (DUF2236 family)
METALMSVPRFTDASMVRRVSHEGVILAGGGRALLMQIAHPEVARGVIEHSAFRSDRLGRLLRTLRPVLAIVFGDEEQARATTARVNAVHAGVVGEGYRATEPALLAWVLATLIDTALTVHGLLVRPLSEEETALYYGDMLAVGEALGMPRTGLPADMAGFRAYMAEMIGSLRVSAEAREIAGELFRGPLALRPAMWAVRELTAGLLPPPLRTQFGLRWGPRRDLLLRGTAAVSRTVVPRLPRRLRGPPGFLMPPRR